MSRRTTIHTSSKSLNSSIGICLVCQHSIIFNQQYLNLIEIAHNCPNRSWKVHKNCFKPVLKDCNCPQYKIQHGNNLNSKPIFESILINDQRDDDDNE